MHGKDLDISAVLAFVDNYGQHLSIRMSNSVRAAVAIKEMARAHENHSKSREVINGLGEVRAELQPTS